MNKNILIASIISGFSFNGYASDSYYVGTGLGYGFLSDVCDISESCQDKGWSGNLHTGYEINPYLATELNLDYLSNFTITEKNINNVDNIMKTDLLALTIAPKFTLPLTPSISIYGKFGGAYITASGESDIVTTASIGYQYKINSSMSFGLEYQTFQEMTSKKIESMDVNIASLRFSYNLGKNETLQSNIADEDIIRPTIELNNAIHPSYITNVYFDFDQSTSSLSDSLNKVIDILKTYRNASVEIIGHSDSTGQEKYNLLLSEKRAKFIFDNLAKQGIPVDRMSISAQGEHSPSASNDTLSGQQKNRRVEIIISSFKY
ncbi:OmpA family protein [Vibrio sp. SM6]|uniref:OmpA family protein n=1 Tax=Vibrio agarilyticus TaxID=2726741 RepID=A0A7X8YFE3_9VIBR|nr:OmpA family protein [Vibrio agarilyticus]NLS11813.1 OmpA family protein [Vibrio agarilyticus]